MNIDEKYCDDRSKAESAINAMFKSGEAAGFGLQAILYDIADAIYSASTVKVNIVESP